MKVLVNGAESTGVRMARLLASLGIQVSLGKHSIRSDDSWTREILMIAEEFGPMQVYLTGSIELETRLVEARRLGINAIPIQGAFMRGIREYPDAVIDCTTKEDASWNLAAIYKTQYHIPHLLPDTVERRLLPTQFLSTPNCKAGREVYDYLLSDSRHAGPDSTTCAMIIGVLLGMVEPEKIAGIDIGIRKSYSGPGEKLPRPLRPTEFEESPSERSDLLDGLPQLENKARVRYNRNPWTHYDRYDISIALRSPLTKDQQGAVISHYFDQRRCILTRHDLGGPSYDQAAQGVNAIKQACAEIGLLESDSLLPTAAVNFPSPYSVLIGGYVPIRTGASLSAIDWLWIATGRAESLDHACMKTEAAEWHGMKLPELKKNMETLLDRENSIESRTVSYLAAA